MEPYIPVSCRIDDTLDAIAGSGQVAEFVFVDENGETHAISAKILDFKIEDRQEFAVIDRAPGRIRLDRFVSADGVQLNSNIC